MKAERGTKSEGAQRKEISFRLGRMVREEGGTGAGAGRMDGNVSSEERREEQRD